jgi:bifunctional enzyme CysN/CysC/sulfate adenylyltransferase subunit 1
MVLKRRYLAKAATWRIVSTAATVSLTIIVTGDLSMGLIIGPIDIVIKLIMYYIHEIYWTRTQFGITTATVTRKQT